MIYAPISWVHCATFYGRSTLDPGPKTINPNGERENAPFSVRVIGQPLNGGCRVGNAQFYSQDLDPSIITMERLRANVTLAQPEFPPRTLGARVHENDGDKFGKGILLGLLLL